MKIKLYVDFDGVILNTIDISYGLIKEMDIKGKDAVEDFFNKLDWVELMNESVPIKDSINNLKKIIDSGLYDVCVLSHVFTDKEKVAKKVFLEKNIPEIGFISVDKKLNKCDVVDCKNAVLVDDYLGNLELWNNKGGIPVKFSDKGKKYRFLTITNLGELIDLYDDIVEILNITM